MIMTYEDEQVVKQLNDKRIVQLLRTLAQQGTNHGTLRYVAELIEDGHLEWEL